MHCNKSRSWAPDGGRLPAPGASRPALGPSQPTRGPSWPSLSASRPVPGPGWPSLSASRPVPGVIWPVPGPGWPAPGASRPVLGPSQPARGPSWPALLQNTGIASCHQCPPPLLVPGFGSMADGKAGVLCLGFCPRGKQGARECSLLWGSAVSLAGCLSLMAACCVRVHSLCLGGLLRMAAKVSVLKCLLFWKSTCGLLNKYVYVFSINFLNPLPRHGCTSVLGTRRN